MKKFTLLLSLFAVFLLAGCENPIYQWLLPEKKDTPVGPLDVNKGWDSSQDMGAYMHSLQAWGGDTTVTLSWTNPSEKRFDHVRIVYSDSPEEIQSEAARTVSAPVSVGKYDRKKVITDLENGRIYYFAVTPMDDQGAELGQALIISAVPHGDDPDRPDDVEDMVSGTGDSRISLSWKLPKSGTDQNASEAKKVASIAVSVVPVEGAADTLPDMLGAYVSGLRNLKPYSVYIRTVNAAGKRSYGVSAVLVPRGAGIGEGSGSNPNEGLNSGQNADAVRNLQAKAGDGQVKLLWEDPVNAPDGGLRVYWALDDDDGQSYEKLREKVMQDAARTVIDDFKPVAATRGTNGADITGLINDSVYFFAVVPVNNSKPIDSPVIISATPAEPNSQRAADVEGLYGTPGDGQVKLFWNFPLPDGVTDIHGVTVRPSEGTEVIIFDGKSGAMVTGLKNGTPYNFTVKTTNRTAPAPAPDDGVPSAGVSVVLTPQEAANAPGTGSGNGPGTSLNLVRQTTNIIISGDYKYLAAPGDEIPVVAYFIDGTWYDGHIQDDGYVTLNYPETRPFVRTFASLYLVRDLKHIYLGRAWDEAPIKLNIDSKGNLLFRDAVNGYIPIATTGELALINGHGGIHLDKNYRQECDLNLLGMQPAMESYRVLNWEPLGKSSAPFTGTYDGNRKEIKYLYINRSLSNSGLFGYTAGSAKLENITVNSCSVAGTSNVGALCGLNGGVISGCIVKSVPEDFPASVKSSGENAGGLTGTNHGEITSSANYSEVETEWAYAGGIAGSNSSGSAAAAIKGCENYGSISARLNAGGIAGGNSANQNRSVIENCTNNGAVSAQECAGGIAGMSSGRIKDSYNRAGGDRKIKTEAGSAGGVAGMNLNGGEIEKCGNTGIVETDADYAGGVCGYNRDSRITNSYNAGTVSGRHFIGGVAGYNVHYAKGQLLPEITACYNTGDVTASGQGAGGVAGVNQGTITASYSKGGTVKASSIAGGVCGLNAAIHYDADDPNDMDRYTAGISACYSTSAVSVSTGNPSGGISGQHNYIAGVLAPHREDGRFQASVIEPFDNFKPGFSLTPTPPEQFAGYSPPKYYEGEAKDCYWSGTGPSAGIGKVEGASPVDNQNTGCTQFSGAAPSAPSGPNWGVGSNPTAGQYWTSSYKLYWE